MSEIGGYFQLELPGGKEFHQPSVRLNSGRNALEYILIAKKYRKIYLPYYTCDVLLEPLQKHHITFEFYEVDDKLEPIFDYQKIDDNDAFLFTNYFGLKDNFVTSLALKVKTLIIDNAQAFYAKPIKDIDTFYSPRKFFGIPDGAYLFTNTILFEKFEHDTSYQRFEHLLKRIDISTEDGYADFTKNDNSLINQPIKLMSPLTQKLLESINYMVIAEKRRENYMYLHEYLKTKNSLWFSELDGQVPMVYPFFDKTGILRNKLTANKIYTALYWQNVISWQPNKHSTEYEFATNIVHLPIDQRYTTKDLDKILQLI